MAILNLDQIGLSAKIATEVNKPLLEQQARMQELLTAARSPSPSMERVVRPFLMIDSAPPAAPVARPLLPGENSEAFISWGKASQFIRPPTDPITAGFGDDLYGSLGAGFRLQNPRDQKKNEETDDALEIAMTEVKRETETVRIEDPTDSSVFIEVKRITKIWFRHSDTGNTYRFEIKRWT